MKRSFRNYARSFAENLDARKAYKWASGLCAAAALGLALDESCVDRYTPPKDTRTDLELVLGHPVEGASRHFDLHTGKEYTGKEISFIFHQSADKSYFYASIWGVETILKNYNETEPMEEFKYWPEEKRFEFRNPLKDSPNGPVPLTKQEVEEAKAEYRQFFSDAARYLRRNMEIERRLREDVLTTGEIHGSHKEPIFTYSWIPSWPSNMFSRTVTDCMEKEYKTDKGYSTVLIWTESRRIVIIAPWGDILDQDGDGYFETDWDGSGFLSGYPQRRIMDMLAPLVGMEDE